MSRVAVIGIDGLDSQLITKFEKDLPNFSKLKSCSPTFTLNSVFPPDSPTAWTTIYTGKNPAEHGIISFKDPFTPFKRGEHLSTDISGKTFWDIAGRKGKKVCILFPHLGYPVWPVNGIMVGRTNEVDIREFDIQVFPQLIGNRYNLSGLEPVTSYPFNIGNMIEPTKKLILKEVDVGLNLFKDFGWDLFFIYFSSLDNIEHLFWMYYDENDPDFIKNNPYQNVIRDFYKFYDQYVIGAFLKSIPPNTVLIILSDHGHAMRPKNVIFFNEILRNNGLLKLKTDIADSIFKGYHIQEKFKNRVCMLINEHRLLGKMASLFLKAYPTGMYLYTKSTSIDQEKTIAYLSDPSGGFKAYSYAGIKINRNLINQNDYEEIREKVISILLTTIDPITSENLVEWAKKREDVYSGPFISKYPDILFKIKDEWGVGWETNGSLYGKSLSHKLHSGNHRQNTAVFLIFEKNDIKIVGKSLLLTDIHEIILQGLEIQ